jgi:nucleoside-diphosphate-sugar epimerase
VPCTAVRPSIVVGDSVSGRTFNFNVIYLPIKLLQYGLLPLVPGGRSATLDIVLVDYVCDALLALGRVTECAAMREWGRQVSWDAARMKDVV